MKIGDLDFSVTTPEEDAVLEHMHVLAKNPEQYLEEARAIGDKKLLESVKRGISVTREMQRIKKVCKIQ